VLARDDTSVEAWLNSLEPSDYNPVNVLYLSPSLALWAGLDDEAGRRVRGLEPGIHVVTEQDPNDPADAKAQEILRAAEVALAESGTGEELVIRLRAVLQSHEATDGASPACIHAEQHGTVSSSTVLVMQDGVRYEHADGPPCQTSYVPVL
jgi:uncharacterized protein with NRDE domain